MKTPASKTTKSKSTTTTAKKKAPARKTAAAKTTVKAASKPAAKKAAIAKTKPTAVKKPAAAKTKKAVVKKPAAPAQPPILKKIRRILEDKKGQDIVILDMKDISSVADYMVLCTGLNTPHLRALADETVKQLRLENPPIVPHRRAGAPESEWLVLDYIDFVIHFFTPGMRSYYALERLWKDAPPV